MDLGFFMGIAKTKNGGFACVENLNLEQGSIFFCPLAPKRLPMASFEVSLVPLSPFVSLAHWTFKKMDHIEDLLENDHKMQCEIDLMSGRGFKEPWPLPLNLPLMMALR